MTFLRRHHHRWIFARPVTVRSFAGRLYVCAEDGCPARRYVADECDPRCGLCRYGSHDACGGCSCCSCVPTTHKAKPRPVASAEAS